MLDFKLDAFCLSEQYVMNYLATFLHFVAR